MGQCYLTKPVGDSVRRVTGKVQSLPCTLVVRCWKHLVVKRAARGCPLRFTRA
jgi:hypothetical protein